jgi:hypothetical protein
MERLKAFGRDQSGSVVTTFAAVLGALLLFGGAAIDYTYAVYQRAHLQKAADAAALAGAKLLATEPKSAEDQAKLVFQGNDATAATPKVSVTNETVTVEASFSQPTFIMHAFGHDHVSIGVRAVAGRGAPQAPCVLVLEPVEKEALYLNSHSKLNTDCPVHVNSSASEALRMNSHSTIHSEETCVTGGWTPGGSAYHPTPKKCAPFPDPLAKLPIPPEASATCLKTDHKVDKSSETFIPGVYCKNLTIENDAVVTLTPGIYTIREGTLKINSGAKLKGDGVLLFFTGKDARLQMDSTSKLEVSAATSGTYADIVIYQDRTTPTDFFMINSDSNSKLSGAIYIPSSDLKLNSHSGTSASTYFQLIVRRLELNSHGTIIIKNKDHKPKQAALGEQSVRLME